MKKWTREIEIDAPVEHVWSYLDGSFEQMRKIMPQVLENKPVKVTEDKVGSIYRQKYQEGKRIMEYDVRTLEYSDTPDRKRLKVGFTLADFFDITAYYELWRIDARKTRLQYTVTNKALKWFAKIFLLFANEKVMVKFLEKVKQVAEAEARE